MFAFLKTVLAAAFVFAVMLVTADSSVADIDAQYGGYAMETVTCDSTTHSVRVDFNTHGEDSGLIGGSDLFPYEIAGAVWVTVWEWNGSWHSSNWQQINAYGTSHVTFDNTVGTTYWYFDYAFATSDGGWDYAGEWANGNGENGWYSDQNGYHSLTSCVS